MLLAAPRSGLSLDPLEFLLKQFSVVAAQGTGPTVWRIAVESVSHGLVNLVTVASDVFSLHQWREAFTKTLRHKGIIILLKPS